MSLSINSVSSNPSAQSKNIASRGETSQNKEKKMSTQTKVIASGLGIAGAITLGVLISKGKFKKKPTVKPPEKPTVKPKENPVEIKTKEAEKVITEEKPKVAAEPKAGKIDVTKLSEAEREKFIREQQAKTDDPDMKAEIRRLVESGLWNDLPEAKK